METGRERTLGMIVEGIRESARTVGSLEGQAARIVELGERMVAVLKAGGKVLTAGNGGSAAEALHMAEELVGRYRTNRRSLAAVSLAADVTALTCIANDFGYEKVFSRQVEGLGREGDLLVVFSASGNSENLRLALEAAEERGVGTAALLGRDGGRIRGMAQTELIVAGSESGRIQEAHQAVLHLVLDIVEEAFVEG